MPSPFPGMDPFLEDPAVFPDLHDSLITYLGEFLNARLPEPYFTGIAARVWIELTQRRIGPDVKILRGNVPVNGGALAGGGGVAIAEAVLTEPVVVHVPHDESREPFLEIYAQPGERLVATIEVLSPANKTPGEQGRLRGLTSPARELYLQKQREILNSQVHLIEIDLLRGGVHSTAVAFDQARTRVGAFDYHVCVHNFEKRDDYFVYPIQLEKRLSVIAVPLLPGDPPVSVDLQAVLDRCYDTRLYRRRIRYRERPPVPPLSPEQAAWAERVLREQGILEASPES